MNKKIISIILTTIVCSSAVISCGNKTTSSTTSSTSSKSSAIETESTNSDDTYISPNSMIGDENTDVKPTLVEKVVTLSDLKEKDTESIKNVLGEPISVSDNISTYEKNDYTFEITYFDSISGKVKITPNKDFKYPIDGANIIKILGVDPEESDTFTPSAMIWNNKFDTYKITVACDTNAVTEEGKVSDKLGYIEVVFAEQYS